MPFLDFILDENGDLLIQNGDFVLADATDQYIMDTIQTEKGELKSNPQFGVGANSFQNGPLDIQAKKQVIETQLKIAAIDVSKIDIVQMADGSFQIVPYLK